MMCWCGLAFDHPMNDDPNPRYRHVGPRYTAGAAPRAEGLDVERLAEWFHDKWESQGIACWHKNQHMASWDCGRDAIEAAEYARLSRPSDERVPESEEPR